MQGGVRRRYTGTLVVALEAASPSDGERGDARLGPCAATAEALR